MESGSLNRKYSEHDLFDGGMKALSDRLIKSNLRVLLAHGAHFDFMISFVGSRPNKAEIDAFGEIIRAEIDASRKLEKIIYESRQRYRDHYTILHKKLRLE